MNFRSHMKPENLGIAIAPMVDVVFLLLIFFLLTWNYARQELELTVTVPEANEGQEGRPSPGDVIINLNTDGTIVVNRSAMTLEQLREMLSKLAGLYPNQAVLLRVDVDSRGEDIVRVLDACSAAKIWNVAFAVIKPE